MKDIYYSRPEVSNSDLSELHKYFNPEFNPFDPRAAFRFGNLVDAMATETDKLDFFQKTVSDYENIPFSEAEWDKALNMRKSFKNDHFCQHLLKCNPVYQKIFAGNVELMYGKIRFSLLMRCKFDLWLDLLNWGGDIKSTCATTESQFKDACYHFDYDRSRVVYMLLSGAEKDVIIGISKVNYKIFKIPVIRGDVFYQSGMDKLSEIAFKYWCLFDNVNVQQC